MNIPEAKIKDRKKAFTAIFTLSIGLSIIGGMLFETVNVNLIEAVVYAVLLQLLLLLFFKDSLKKRILLGGLQTLLYLFSKRAAGILFQLTIEIQGISLNQEYGYHKSDPGYLLLFNIYFVLVLFTLFMLFFILWKRLVEHFWIKEYLLYVIVPLYQLTLVWIYFAACKEIGKAELITGILLLIFSLIIDFGILHMVTGMVKKIEIEKELTVLYTQRRTEQKFYEIARQNMEDMSRLRHSFGEQLQTLYQLIEQGDNTEEVKEILDASSEQLQTHSMKRYCENSIVNAILMTKIKMAEEKNIEIECKCNVPEDIKMELIDLCSLFANLMDNAIEACEKIQDKSKRWISVRVNINSGYLIIKVKNSYSIPVVEEKGKILTSKRDRENHGYGIRLIDEITKKYYGNMDIRTENLVFSLLITLKAA